LQIGVKGQTVLCTTVMTLKVRRMVYICRMESDNHVYLVCMLQFKHMRELGVSLLNRGREKGDNR